MLISDRQPSKKSLVATQRANKSFPFAQTNAESDDITHRSKSHTPPEQQQQQQHF